MVSGFWDLWARIWDLVWNYTILANLKSNDTLAFRFPLLAFLWYQSLIIIQNKTAFWTLYKLSRHGKEKIGRICLWQQSTELKFYHNNTKSNKNFKESITKVMRAVLRDNCNMSSRLPRHWWQDRSFQDQTFNEIK